MKGTMIDLSLSLAEDLPCAWPTHVQFQHKTWTWFVDRPDPVAPVVHRGGPYSTKWLAIDEHTGTHADAPSHFIPPPGSGLPAAGPAGEVTIDRVPVDACTGPAAVLDLRDVTGTRPGISPEVGPDRVLDWESRHGALAPGDVVLLCTGWDRHYRPGPAGSAYVHDVVVTGTAPGWPAPAPETVRLLLARGVRCVGTDAPSLGAAHDAQPVHVLGLSGGAVFVECLTGLAALPPRGADFCFLPLKLRGGTGAPGRAVAWLAGDIDGRQ
jgi:isatin hydrolase